VILVALKDMSVWETMKWRFKKVIIELTSLKFWGTVFLGYLNYHFVFSEKRFDLFGMMAFLALLGIRQAGKFLEQKQMKDPGQG
jgi:hypothetical protein